MKISYPQFQQLFTNLNWAIEMCAEKLTSIGHETDVFGDTLDVKLTANRADCKDINYLAFDFAAIFTDLQLNEPIKLEYNSNVIEVKIDSINKILGSNFKQTDLGALNHLGFKVNETSIEIPAHRKDITNVSDIAEEMLRIYGVKHIQILPLSTEKPPKSGLFEKIQSIKQQLVGLGYSETVTNTFVHSGEVELKNPFSADLPYLQTDLISGLLQTTAKNPYLKRSKFFQIANVFNENEEVTILGVIISGYKNTIDQVNALDQEFKTSFEQKTIESLMLNKFDVKQSSVVYAWKNVEDLTSNNLKIRDKLSKFKPISKFPPLVRDITVEGEISVEENLGKVIENVLFVEKIDSYQNPETNQVKNTFRIIIQKFDDSFTETEIKKIDELLATQFIG
ncbi:hypothetical protein HY844_01080 [Candidatus Berkelbacteria bacterium]|nr:hypothetical protein [Candidatus Berkelbacteria bacterium]